MSISSVSATSVSSAQVPRASPAPRDPARPGVPPGQQGALSEADLQLVNQLKARDREVRAHEMAHLAAGAGIVTGGVSYSYQSGPDGRRYAVGGEVRISLSPGRTPEETLAKADQIRAAALAPAEPSGQDRKVAADAAQMAAVARAELAALAQEAAASGGGGRTGPYRIAEAEGGRSYQGMTVDTYA
ncbi:putative metalloprotease CJM1_0395 family protein [Zoogloea sp.]|uniref:putative metalloprotease CJM1_0395 family protein n=1 Tax=Zoogloea sp. TaxID=49181 RepID=UPI00260FEBBF|nr:putative metalloprotease CJM1_0395 family protein [Zoogloea sp.]MDD3354653.1 putative metalloprotease CJM1_0395 family protein [Zoogloea sp.]